MDFDPFYLFVNGYAYTFLLYNKSEMTKKIDKQNKHILKRIILGFGCLIGLVVIILGIYFATYYRAGDTAKANLETRDGIIVENRSDYVLFDGPSESNLFVFYPGARVDYRAYAPLMRRLAEQGVDCALVKMPLNFAIFKQNAFDDVMGSLQVGYQPYEHFYIGGHSMGGAMAAVYAANNPEKVEALIMLAAYPTKPLAEDLKVLEIYGSNDNVINREKLSEGAQFLPEKAVVYEIAGGNHAQFGDYGKQSGDGEATISADAQLDETVEQISNLLMLK